jgi:repressor LexA
MLTERQEAILDFVREYQRAQGTAPSTREVARYFTCAQPTALKHLQVLARKGELDKLADGKWGFKGSVTQAQLFDIPVFGSIPAGLPALREQEPEEVISLDPAMLRIRNPSRNHLWFLRVTGDSMIGAHICDGDLVALERREAKPGDIIAALVNDTDTTLKRLVKDRGRMILRAENPRYADIVPQHFESQGVVVGVLRRKIV